MEDGILESQEVTLQTASLVKSIFVSILKLTLSRKHITLYYIFLKEYFYYIKINTV